MMKGVFQRMGEMSKPSRLVALWREERGKEKARTRRAFSIC